MKYYRLVLLIFMFAFYVLHCVAQSSMTDQQVVEYAKNAMAAGKSKEEIAKELILKGVSR